MGFGGDVDRRAVRSRPAEPEQADKVPGVRYLQALRSIEQAIAVVGPDENLLRSLSVYRRNFEAKAHNEMVEAYQADRYEEAKRILEAALQQLPDSDDLKKDLETLEKALESRP